MFDRLTTFRSRECHSWRAALVTLCHVALLTACVGRRAVTPCDDGKSWPVAVALEPGPAGYSTLATLANGDVGILYERGRYQYITVARFTPQWPRECR